MASTGTVPAPGARVSADVPKSALTSEWPPPATGANRTSATFRVSASTWAPGSEGPVTHQAAPRQPPLSHACAYAVLVDDATAEEGASASSRRRLSAGAAGPGTRVSRTPRLLFRNTPYARPTPAPARQAATTRTVNATQRRFSGGVHARPQQTALRQQKQQ